MSPAGRRVVLVALGTRGDVQPLCVLGEALLARGHDVRLVTTPDYRDLGEASGLDVAEIGPRFRDLLEEPSANRLLRGSYRLGLGVLPALLGLRRAVMGHVVDLLAQCEAEIAGAGLVVYGPMAFFAGELAAEAGIASIRAMMQPLVPNAEEPLCLLGRGDLGSALNRLSYEMLRLPTLLMRSAFAEFRSRTGRGGSLRGGMNPLRAPRSRHDDILAWSPALYRGATRSGVAPSGFWRRPPGSRDALPAEVAGFLASGPPPIHVGLGSMTWGARAHGPVIARALSLWGGRAIVAPGLAGHFPEEMREHPSWLVAGGMDHAALFPRLAGVAHHGGAGTAGAALAAGQPSLVLPVLGDQLFWGRRLAALGAAEEPIRLDRIAADELARRMERLAGDPARRQAAGEAASAMSADPGLAAAIDLVERRFEAGHPRTRSSSGGC